MRTAIPVLCLFLCGCGTKPVTQEAVTDSFGSNQLVRVDRDVSSIMDIVRSRQSYDFDSIVWRTNANGTWRDHIVISSAAFQAGSPRRRWVSQIHSLDATKGIAIIKVAEGDVPEGSPSVHYIYSWREWSLLTNGEVRMIRTCINPFEKY